MLASDLLPPDYEAFLAGLKERIRRAQVRAALAVNRELVLLYWQIGQDILLYMRSFAQAWPDEAIVQQVAGHIPWFHNCVLLDRVKDPEACPVNSYRSQYREPAQTGSNSSSRDLHLRRCQTRTPDPTSK